MIEEQKLIEYFLGLLGQIKVFHWATTEYSKHKALDDLHGSMSSLVDKVIESYLGRYNKQPVKVFKIAMEAHSDMTKLAKFLETERETIRKMLPHFKGATEICTVIDDMLTAFNTCVYICNLK